MMAADRGRSVRPDGPTIPPRTSDDAIRLSELGPFFAVAEHRFDDSPQTPWQPLRDLIQRPGRLEARVAAVRGALAPGGRLDLVERRVAVSVAHLGLVARLLAPQLAVAALGLTGLEFGLDRLWWQDRIGGPFPLSVARTSGGSRELVVDLTLAGDITEACLERFPVAASVLWGNVGSALNGAVRQLNLHRPDLADRARALTDGLLADGRIDRGLTRSGPAYRRRSCCLIYRIARSRSVCCGDCVLVGG